MPSRPGSSNRSGPFDTTTIVVRSDFEAASFFNRLGRNSERPRHGMLSTIGGGVTVSASVTDISLRGATQYFSQTDPARRSMGRRFSQQPLHEDPRVLLVDQVMRAEAGRFVAISWAKAASLQMLHEGLDRRARAGKASDSIRPDQRPRV